MPHTKIKTNFIASEDRGHVPPESEQKDEFLRLTLTVKSIVINLKETNVVFKLFSLHYSEPWASFRCVFR